jgi:uncharacterized protein
MALEGIMKPANLPLAFILSLLACLFPLVPRAEMDTASALFSAGASEALPQLTLKIGRETLQAEIASTPSSMARGLMFRTSLPTDQGMLFVFPVGHQASFWMKNTSLPLSIAYIDQEGRILEIHPLIPFDETPVKSKSDNVYYALEVNRDWFNVRQIKPGDQIQNLPRVKISGS